MMLALEMFRSLPRTVAGKAMGARMPGILSGFAAPLRLVTIDEPKVDRPGWARLRTRLSGICGSDLGALSGQTSLYFSAVVSLPFVPGHEVVAELLDDCEDLPAGTRVVVDPVLDCAARGVEPCEAARPAPPTVLRGSPSATSSPGLQTGFCKDTGGGWGQQLAAHRSQLHAGAGGLLRRAGAAHRAGGVRGAHRAAGRGRANDRVLVSGAGSVGLFATLALRQPDRRPARSSWSPSTATSASSPTSFGATEVVAPGEVLRRVRRVDRRLPAQARVLLAVPARRRRRRRRRGRQQAVAGDRAARDPGRWPGRAVRDAGGRGPLGGVVPRAGGGRLLRVVPAEPAPDGRSAFDVATELVAGDAVAQLAKSVASYPLHRWREALDHAHARRPASARSRSPSTRGAHR